MRIVVDTNIIFSAILNTDSSIARILIKKNSNLFFYSTDLLLLEIEHHKDKIKKIAGYSEFELKKIIALLTRRIRFIDARLIPRELLLNSQRLLSDIDIDDTEFVALTDYIKGKLWSGDKVLTSRLAAKGWKKTVTTKELLSMIKIK